MFGIELDGERRGSLSKPLENRFGFPGEVVNGGRRHGRGRRERAGYEMKVVGQGRVLGESWVIQRSKCGLFPSASTNLMSRTPLTQRPLDLLYFLFFLVRPSFFQHHLVSLCLFASIDLDPHRENLLVPLIILFYPTNPPR